LVAEFECFDRKFNRLGWVSFLLSPGFSAPAGGGKQQLERRAASGVFRPPAVFVFIDTVVEVVGDTGVKRLIGVLQDINNPV
jgi:hypothetical protein